MRFSPLIRISLALMLITTTVLLTAEIIGLTPNEAGRILDARKTLCESMAVQFSSLAQKNDMSTIEETLVALVERDDDILSAGIRRSDGSLLAEAGAHQVNWEAMPADLSTPTNAQVPIFNGESRWGTVEVRFTPVTPDSLLSLWKSSVFRLTLFVAVVGFVLYTLFMRKALRELDPTSVVPARVKYALDVLAEGVILVDDKGEIVLANATFSEKLGRGADTLVGRKASELKWTSLETGEPVEDLPWLRAMREGQRQSGVPMSVQSRDGSHQLFVVSGAPILDGKGNSRGGVATFNDVTELERKNHQLEETLRLLKESRDEVERQNRELKIMADQDPLTRCLNRRAFFQRLERQFIKASAGGEDLACVMCDIDHFKTFNDQYGHAVGDKVLEKVAEVLRGSLNANELICRYGGEEFCIIVPGVDESQAIERAQAMRRAIEEAAGSTIRITSQKSITASFGVSCLSMGARESSDLLNQADKALYVSKDAGRNRVTLWDPVEASQRPLAV